ncbi:hypothetical protein PoHVEF18_008755 [Penicillium ochrochloron]
MKLFPTIARQLVIIIPQLIPGIQKALYDDPDIAGKPLGEQFDKLLLQPFLKLKTANDQIPTVLIVIDALDECEGDEDVQIILQLLSQLPNSTNAVRLRIFLTSRPELPIRLGFSKIKSHEHQDLVLHEIPEPVIEHEISLFLKHRLAAIRTDRFLPVSWPGESVIETLVTFSAPSFVFAATVCRIFEDPNWDPVDSLAEIIPHLSMESKLHNTYIPAFSRLLNEENGPEEQQILHSEAEDDPQTDIESIFSLESILSSQSSQGEITSLAILQLAHLLLNDNELMLLYPTAISKVGPDKFQRNFARFLGKYGRRLNGEATSELQRQAAHFVSQYARRTAAQMRIVLMQKDGQLSIGKEPDLDVSKSTQVNAWIESQRRGRLDSDANAVESSVDELSADSDSADSDSYGHNSLSSLEGVKEFMISAKAFLDLRRELQEWLEVKRSDNRKSQKEKIEEGSRGVHGDCHNSDPNIAHGQIST